MSVGSSGDPNERGGDMCSSRFDSATCLLTPLDLSTPSTEFSLVTSNCSRVGTETVGTVDRGDKSCGPAGVSGSTCLCKDRRRGRRFQPGDNAWTTNRQERNKSKESEERNKRKDRQITTGRNDTTRVSGTRSCLCVSPRDIRTETVLDEGVKCTEGSMSRMICYNLSEGIEKDKVWNCTSHNSTFEFEKKWNCSVFANVSDRYYKQSELIGLGRTDNDSWLGPLDSHSLLHQIVKRNDHMYLNTNTNMTTQTPYAIPSVATVPIYITIFFICLAMTIIGFFYKKQVEEMKMTIRENETKRVARETRVIVFNNSTGSFSDQPMDDLSIDRTKEGDGARGVAPAKKQKSRGKGSAGYSSKYYDDKRSDQETLIKKDQDE